MREALFASIILVSTVASAEQLALAAPARQFCVMVCTPDEEDGTPDWMPASSWLLPFCPPGTTCDPIPGTPDFDNVTQSWRFPCAVKDVGFGQCSKPIPVPLPMAPPPKAVDPIGELMTSKPSATTELATSTEILPLTVQ